MPSKNKRKKSSVLLCDESLAVTNALAEDIGSGDITCSVLIDDGVRARARLILKDRECVLCGLGVLREVFRQIDTRVKVTARFKDGARIKKGQEICVISGPAASILKGERTALNFLSHLSAVATLTHSFAAKVKGTRARILDTRKTTPGMRRLEKYAVRTGGGTNHRLGLYDQVLIKDNHIAICLKHQRLRGFGEILKKARKKAGEQVIIIIEIENLRDLETVLKSSPDIVLLDNMRIPEIRRAVALRDRINKKVDLEVSGNIDARNVARVAGTGVERISLGCLTHSAGNIDFSLRMKV